MTGGLVRARLHAMVPPNVVCSHCGHPLTPEQVALGASHFSTPRCRGCGRIISYDVGTTLLAPSDEGVKRALTPTTFTWWHSSARGHLPEDFAVSGIDFFHVGTRQAAVDRAHCVVKTDGVRAIYLYEVTLSPSCVFASDVRVDDDFFPDGRNYVYSNRYEDIGEPSLRVHVRDVSTMTLSRSFSAEEILDEDSIYSLAETVSVHS